MNFTFKKLSILALSLTMLLSSCGNKDNSANKEASETKTETSEQADKPDTWIADREIDLLVFQEGSDVGEGTMSPEIADYIKEKTGITLNIQAVTTDNAYEALAAGLASGDLPDAIAYYLNNSGRPEFPILLKAANEGMFHDLAPYLKEGKTYGKYFEEGYLPSDTKRNIMMRDDWDGATYLVHMSIPRNPADPDPKYIGGLYIRKDIAEDLGVEMDSIHTAEELEEVLRKIQDGDFKDVNGNPVVPLGPTIWGGSDRPWPYRNLIWEGQGAQKILKDKDGNIKHECMTDYAEKRVELVRRWLEDGLMHPEYYTIEENRAREGILNQSYGIISDTHSRMIEMQNMAYIPLGDLQRADGTDNMVVAYKSGYSGWAIPSTTENPEEIVKFADWLAGPEGKLLYFYGLEGKHYDLVDGKPVPKKELVELMAEDPDAAKKEGFRGVGAYWGEHFAYTDMANLEDFGETSWGDESSDNEDSAAVKYIEMYDFDKKYEEKTVIDGLHPAAYLYEFEGDDGGLAQAMQEWDEDIVKAYYAKSEEEAKAIIEESRRKLKDAGIEDFCKFLKEKEDEGDTIFY